MAIDSLSHLAVFPQIARTSSILGSYHSNWLGCKRGVQAHTVAENYLVLHDAEQ